MTDTLRSWSAGFKSITLTGPRQSGKTTLARQTFPDLPYVSLENPDVRERAVQDPRGFLSQISEGAILDEIQRAPELFSYLQQILDEQKEMGRWIFTGSQQFGLGENISQSLAGRTALLTLYPFSHQELKQAGKADFDLAKTLFRGGYPPLYDPGSPVEPWLNAYVATYLERDVRQILEIRNMEAFRTFLRLCAGSIGQEVNLSRLGADSGVQQGTIREWLTVLEASYVIIRIPSFHKNYRKRLVKRPKVYFVDSGLAARLIGLEESDQWWTHPLRGALFENWVVMETIKARANQGKDPNCFYWRENNGLEIDLLREEGGKVYPVEMKSGATFSPDWIKGLTKWAALAGKESETPELIYGGGESFTYQNTRVTPWSDL